MDDNFTIFIQIIYIAINYFSFALKKKKSQIIFPILYKSTSHCYINQISDNSLQKKKKERKEKENNRYKYNYYDPVTATRYS